MKANTNIHKAETITGSTNRFGHQDGANTVNALEMQAGTAEPGRTKGKPESELRAAPGGTASP